MIFILLPCLNEAENLKIIIPEIHKLFQNNNYVYKILVCYDCSTDNTENIVNNFKKKSINIELLDYKNKMGLGIAFLRLFKEAVKQKKTDNDIIITLDADNTHDPNGILLLLNKINSGYDLAIQSRFCKNSLITGFSNFRKLISLSISIVLRIIFPVGENIKDYTSSYRAYKISILEKAFEKFKDNFITETEFTYTIETIIKINTITKKITETPLKYRYDKKIGRSKLKLIKNGYRFIILITKLFFLK